MKNQCFNEETLADYMEGHLSSENNYEMEAHLSECDMCLESFIVGKNLSLSGPPELEHAPIHVTQAAISLVADMNTPPLDLLVKRTGAFAKDIYAKVSDYIAPVFWEDSFAIRGEESISEDCFHIRKKFKESGMETEIEIEKTGEDKANIRVILAGSAREDTNIRATLKKDDREISSLLFDENYTLFENIPFDHYDLIFTRHGQELGSYAFTLREPSHEKD